jgi:hypothetical protein
LGTVLWESKLELLHSCVPKLELGNKKNRSLSHGVDRRGGFETRPYFGLYRYEGRRRSWRTRRP